MTLEDLVNKYGEENRKVIELALKFLEEREPEWKLDQPVDKDEYIKSVLERYVKREV